MTSGERGMGRRRRGSMVAGALTAGLLLAGCSGGDTPSGLKTFTGSSSTSPSTATSSAPSSSPTSVDNGLPKTLAITRGAVPAKLTADQRAATDAWLAYWDYLGKAYQVPAVDVRTVGSVMRGSARANVEDYVGLLQQRKRRVVGTAVVDVLSVKVSGSTATVCSRLRDRSFEVNRAGVPQETTLPQVYFDRGGLTRSGPTWLVTSNVTGASVCR